MDRIIIIIQFIGLLGVISCNNKIHNQSLSTKKENVDYFVIKKNNHQIIDEDSILTKCNFYQIKTEYVSDENCESTLDYYQIKGSVRDSILKGQNDSIWVQLIGDLNGQGKIIIDNEVYYEGIFKTNTSIGIVGGVMIYHKKDKSKTTLLLEYNGFCTKIFVEQKGYKYLSVFFVETSDGNGKWLARYEKYRLRSR